MGLGDLTKKVQDVADRVIGDSNNEDLNGIKQQGTTLLTELAPKIVEKKISEKENVPLPPDEVNNRRALVIGINYANMPPGGGQLKGCINDAHNVSSFLQDQGFSRSDIRLLTDDNQNDGLPTRDNLIAGMKWLVEGASAGDSLFFHYSGHGGQAEDTTGMEEDGLDETIMPADFQVAGQITDDEMHDIMVRNLPAQVRLTAIFDSCHSGTALDLPFVYHSKADEYKTAHKEDDGGIVGRHVELKTQVNQPTKLGNQLLHHLHDELTHQTQKHTKRAMLESVNTSDALVMMVAGCRDEQTSSDTQYEGANTGAMSYALIKVLRENSDQTWATLIKAMRDTLHHGDRKFTQMPQLSMGRPVAPDTKFIV